MQSTTNPFALLGVEHRFFRLKLCKRHYTTGSFTMISMAIFAFFLFPLVVMIVPLLGNVFFLSISDDHVTFLVV